MPTLERLKKEAKRWLERVSFYGCPGVTNAGVARLAGLPRLCEIHFSGPHITRDVAAVFPATVRVEHSV